ncbi:tetratricopeptide repeat protein [Aquimarina sp. 2201CG1-2-11]|uniref:tetratricopeptide repeat-containing sensor histidine kinase n=1 Tax=Aquimarina discodermiae TaxID=3231043 RepID=UPI003461D0F4
MHKKNTSFYIAMTNSKIVKIILFFFTLLSACMYGQIDSKNNISPIYDILEEGKIIEELRALTNKAIDGPDINGVYEKVGKHLKPKKNRSTQFKANLHLILASYFNKKSQFDTSIHHAQSVLGLKTFRNDSIKYNVYGLAYHWLGVVNGKMGLIDKAKKWHLKGIETAQKYDDKRIYYMNSFGLANRLSNTGESKESDMALALELYKKCSEYIEYKKMVFGSLINIATIYGIQGNHDEAAKYLKKALEICKKNNDLGCIGTISFNLGITYKKQDNLPLALESISESIKIAKNNGFDRMQIMGYLEKGQVLSLLKKYEEGEVLIFKALDKAKELNLLDNQKAIYFRLKEIAILQNDYKKALDYSEKFNEVSDSIKTLDKDNEISELEVKYETLKKEKEIKVLQVENTNRKLELSNQKEAFKNLKLQQEVKEIENRNQILAIQNASEKKANEINLLKKDQELQEASLIRQKSIKNTILYSFLIILMPIIGLLFMYYQKLQAQSQLNQKEKEVNQQKITTLLKDQELKVIKASIEGQGKERKRIAQELHDSIGGNLAAIKLQLNNPKINEQGYIKGVNHQIDDTYQQVRNLSHNLIPKKFSKNNFCDVLEEYINNIGNASSIKISFAVYPRKDIDILEEELQFEIFKIIQELITNTIKHAQADAVELHLNLADNNVLNVIFEDNGIGFNSEKQTHGLGLSNIQSRLEKIFGTLIIDSRKGRGTIINIEITNIEPVTYPS